MESFKRLRAPGGACLRALLILAGLFAATAMLTACASRPPSGSDAAGATTAASGVADPEANPIADPEASTEADHEADAEADPEAGAEADAEADPEAGEAEGDEGDEEEGTAVGSAGTLVVYSGRSESLVQPLFEDFERETGIDVEARWGGTSELAATLLEEGEASPADVFFAQDPGGLGAVKPLLAPLPKALLGTVKPGYADPDGRWVGVSGRARTVVYNTENVAEADLPADIQGFTDPKWKGRIGWAPSNASFQAMVTAMRQAWGEARTRTWLRGILANEPTGYEGNAPIVAAVGAGEIDVGFVNHYYLYRFLEEEGEDFPARNDFLPGGGPGSLVLVSGAGILDRAKNREAAEAFVAFLLSKEAQQYFADETFEYPLTTDPAVSAPVGLTPLDELESMPIDLEDLADLEGTLDLLRDEGVLP